MRTILCYGDSNTWGYEPETDGRLPWKKRYPGILKQRLGAGYRVEENGLCGKTTQYDSETEPFVNGLKSAARCIELYAPVDIVFLMLGTNDCKDVYGASPDEIADGAEKVGRVFAERGARILLVAPPPVEHLERSPFRDEFGEGAQKKSIELWEAYKKTAKRNGWTAKNAAQAVKPGSYDGIHLDAGGHQKLAEAAAHWIRKMEVE